MEIYEQSSEYVVLRNTTLFLKLMLEYSSSITDLVSVKITPKCPFTLNQNYQKNFSLVSLHFNTSIQYPVFIHLSSNHWIETEIFRFGILESCSSNGPFAVVDKIQTSTLETIVEPRISLKNTIQYQIFSTQDIALLSIAIILLFGICTFCITLIRNYSLQYYSYKLRTTIV